MELILEKQKDGSIGLLYSPALNEIYVVGEITGKSSTVDPYVQEWNIVFSENLTEAILKLWNQPETLKVTLG